MEDYIPMALKAILGGLIGIGAIVYFVGAYKGWWPNIFGGITGGTLNYGG